MAMPASTRERRRVDSAVVSTGGIVELRNNPHGVRGRASRTRRPAPDGTEPRQGLTPINRNHHKDWRQEMSAITAHRTSEDARSRSGLYRTLFEWGGFAAGAVLVAFGVVAIVMGFSGRGTVADSLKQEKIVGSPDMTPALIVKEAKA